MGVEKVFQMNKKLATTIINTLLRTGPRGSHRQIFYCYYDNDNCVVKMCQNDTIQNFMEYEIWSQFQYTDEGKKWLAQCPAMSQDGRVLVQERLSPLSLGDSRLPDKIPNFFTDTKVQNWGVDKEGNVKCLDYGSSKLLQNKPWKLVKADWWEE